MAPSGTPVGRNPEQEPTAKAGACRRVDDNRSMTEKEKTLLAGCVKGDKVAWDAFVLQYSKLAYSTIRKTLALHHTEQRDDVVEDLYQEFFLSLLQGNCRKQSQFRGEYGCTLASWLRVVASRLTIDYLRKQRANDVELTEALASDQPEAPEKLIGEGDEKLLSRAPRNAISSRSAHHSAFLPASPAAARDRRHPQNIGRRGLHSEKPDFG